MTRVTQTPSVPARPVLALAVLAMSACAPAAPAPEPDFTFDGQGYVIERDQANWRVGVPGDTVICRRPTVEDCYWSLRARLAARAALDEIP